VTTIGGNEHSPIRVAVVFEYSTLLGGERSMLACTDWWKRHDESLDIVGVVPPAGPLIDSLKARSIDVVVWEKPDADMDNSSALNDLGVSLLKSLLQTQPDVIHGNSLSMGRQLGRIVSSTSNAIAIPTSCHLRDIVKLSAAAVRDLNELDSLIAVSEATGRFHTRQGVESKRIRVIPNGLDLQLFCPREKTGSLCRELGISSESKVILTIGQIGLRKGQDVLAEAAPMIVRSVPSVHFVLVGERTSTKQESVDFERSISQSFESNGLSDRLHWLGRRSDVEHLIPECDVLVHPANQEPYGRVLLEAAACGIPVVATDVGGTSEIVVDQGTGLLVPPKNPGELARATIEVLANDSVRKVLGHRARERAIKLFDVGISAEAIARQWRSLYSSRGVNGRTIDCNRGEPGASAQWHSR